MISQRTSNMTMSPEPLLVYDGDCAFCCYCVDYAKAATGPAVAYRPYQQVHQNFPQISQQQFREAIQLILPSGAVHSGAGAALLTLSLGKHPQLWYRLYSAVPLFRVICEWCYRFVARHRSGCYRACRLLLGSTWRPAQVTLVSWLFLRLLALVYLAAFASFAGQAAGLIGEHGILPARQLFAAMDASYGPEKYWMLPSVLWLDTSDHAIQFVALVGCALSLLLFFNKLPRLCLCGLYLLYLSLFHAGQLFMSYQWDVLLLECGFLAIFLPWRPRLFIWLYRLLLARFMLQSGLVKLLSGDSAWRHLTALDFHFETQPLPTIVAWYAHKLPMPLLHAGVLFTLLVELFVPLLMLLPRRPRFLAALCTALLQLGILATGSYNFFNLLTLCLCLLLLDDQSLRRLIPARLLRWAAVSPPASRQAIATVPVLLAATVYLVQSALLLTATGNPLLLPAAARQLLTLTTPFHIANNYGLFAQISRQRREIIIEGSRDGHIWLPYELPYKPGALTRPPRLATPGQPRLDWQLWFAAQHGRDDSPWFGRLINALLQGSPAVTTLFAGNPFGNTPPRYIRASLYRYHFASSAERRTTGAWWTREYIGRYWPTTAWQLPMQRTDALAYPPHVGLHSVLIQLKR